MRYNNTDVVREIAQRTGFTKPEVSLVIDELKEFIYAETYQNGNEVVLKNFGTFRMAERKGGMRDFGHGQIDFPTTKRIRFDMAKRRKKTTDELEVVPDSGEE